MADLITHIHIYSGALTKGGTDGIIVSEGDHSKPLVIGPLNIGNQEVSAPVKCAIRCDSSVKTVGTTFLTLTGDTASNWQLALDNKTSDPADPVNPLVWMPWGAPLKIDDIVDATNYTFWIRSRTVNADVPGRDKKVSLVINANLYGE